MFSINGDVRKMLLGSFVSDMDDAKKIVPSNGYPVDESSGTQKRDNRHSLHY